MAGGDAKGEYSLHVSYLPEGTVPLPSIPWSRLSEREGDDQDTWGLWFPLAPTLRCQPRREHVTSNLAIVVAAMPGAPSGSLVMNLTPALAPVGMALLVLAVLGAIVLLVGRDAHHPAAPGCRRAEVAGGERPSSGASRPGSGLIARSSSTAALRDGPVRPARHPPAIPQGFPKAIGR